jgi:hypothetical protein
MGLKKSWLSALVFFGGVTGLTIAVILTFYPSSIEYPLIVAGKPVDFFTVPAFFPIMFELTVLLSAFTATFGMLALNGLLGGTIRMFNWDTFKKVSDDGFFIAIESADPKFDERDTRAHARGHGRDQTSPGARRLIHVARLFHRSRFSPVVLLVAVAGWRGQKSGKPPIEIFPDMDHQPR